MKRKKKCLNCNCSLSSTEHKSNRINISCKCENIKFKSLCDDCYYSYDRTLQCVKCCKYKCCGKCCAYNENINKLKYKDKYNSDEILSKFLKIKNLRNIIHDFNEIRIFQYTNYIVGYSYRLLPFKKQLASNGVILIKDNDSYSNKNIHKINKSDKNINILKKLIENYSSVLIKGKKDGEFPFAYYHHCGGNYFFAHEYKKNIYKTPYKCLIINNYFYRTDYG